MSVAKTNWFKSSKLAANIGFFETIHKNNFDTLEQEWANFLARRPDSEVNFDRNLY